MYGDLPLQHVDGDARDMSRNVVSGETAAEGGLDDGACGADVNDGACGADAGSTGMCQHSTDVRSHRALVEPARAEVARDDDGASGVRADDTAGLTPGGTVQAKAPARGRSGSHSPIVACRARSGELEAAGSQRIAGQGGACGEGGRARRRAIQAATQKRNAGKGGGRPPKRAWKDEEGRAAMLVHGKPDSGQLADSVPLQASRAKGGGEDAAGDDPQHSGDVTEHFSAGSDDEPEL